MNNLMLHFSGADLSRLRVLVADVEKQVVGGRDKVGPADRQPKTALETSWSRLVALLDLGSEPEMRECPSCHAMGMAGATRCGNCWASLPAVAPKEKRAA